MKRLRVLHVIPALAPRYGGPSRAVLAMGSALADLGVDVHIAATDADGPSRLEPESSWLAQGSGCTIHLFPSRFGESLKFSAPLASWLAEEIPGFDVVHIHAVFSHACLAAGRIAERAGVPFIVRPLGTIDRWSLSQKWIRKRVFLAAGALRMLDSAAGVHCTSDQEESEVRHLVPAARTFVSPLGVPSPGRSEGTHRNAVVFLGRLHAKKRVELLIEAFARVAGSVEHELVIAGSGDATYASGLVALAGKLLPASRVRFTGWLDDEARAVLLSRAALVVLPSHQENFGLAAAEAMGFAVPVLLSTDVALANEVAEARAGWVARGDAESLAAGLVEALTSTSELGVRGGNAVRLAREKYSWPAVGRQLLSDYLRLG